jgi:uncharacterized membrane protein YeaQ/YmgE (transglycosylase-associated protein family)
LTVLGASVAAWAAAGALGGWLGRVVVKGTKGVAIDLLVGILGGVAGGWLFSWYGHLYFSHLSVGSVIVAFIAAVVLLSLSRFASVKKTV